MHQSCLSPTTCPALMLVCNRTYDCIQLSHKRESTGALRDSCSAQDNDKGSARHFTFDGTLLRKTFGITWAPQPLGMWQWKVNGVYIQTYPQLYSSVLCRAWNTWLQCLSLICMMSASWIWMGIKYCATPNHTFTSHDLNTKESDTNKNGVSCTVVAAEPEGSK